MPAVIVGLFFLLGCLRWIMPGLVAEQILRDAYSDLDQTPEGLSSRIEIERASHAYQAPRDADGIAWSNPEFDASLAERQDSARLLARRYRVGMALRTLDESDLRLVGEQKSGLSVAVDAELDRRNLGGARYRHAAGHESPEDVALRLKAEKLARDRAREAELQRMRHQSPPPLGR